MMAFGITYKLQQRDVKRILKSLRGLPPAVQRRALIKGLSAAGGIIKAAAKPAAPMETGLLAGSLRVMRMRAKPGEVKYRVSPRSIKKAFTKSKAGRLRGISARKQVVAAKTGVKIYYRNPARYAHLTELGHRIVRGGRDVGMVAGTRWLSKAYDRGERAAIVAIERQVDQVIAATF